MKQKSSLFFLLIMSLFYSSNASEVNFDALAGIEYSEFNPNNLSKSRILNESLQFDSYYKDYSFNFSTSYYHPIDNTTTDKGMNDSTISLSRNSLITENFNVIYGVGAVLPTYKSIYNNNKTDYFANISLNYNVQSIDGLKVFAGTSYTLINDKDIINTVEYQDTYSVYAGTGLSLSPQDSINISYNQQQNMFKGSENIKSVSVNSFNYFDDFFTILSYKKGLTDTTSDNTISLKLGINF